MLFGYNFDKHLVFRQIFEYDPHGTLKQFIKNQSKALNSVQIMAILLQVNNGLIHIHQNEIVQPDFETRKCIGLYHSE